MPISLITLQYARAQYKNDQTCIREIVTKRLESFPLTKTRVLRGGSPGQVENRPDFVLVFGDFGGSTRYRSKSVEGRPVLVGFRQFTELEPRLAGCVVLECGIKSYVNTSLQLREYVPPLLEEWRYRDPVRRRTASLYFQRAYIIWPFRSIMLGVNPTGL